jgi:hypothetical protein
MISNRRLDIHIPVAAPEADRDVPQDSFGFTSRAPTGATANSRRRRDIGKRPLFAQMRWFSSFGSRLALAIGGNLDRLAEHGGIFRAEGLGTESNRGVDLRLPKRPVGRLAAAQAFDQGTRPGID